MKIVTLQVIEYSGIKLVHYSCFCGDVFLKEHWIRLKE